MRTKNTERPLLQVLEKSLVRRRRGAFDFGLRAFDHGSKDIALSLSGAKSGVFGRQTIASNASHLGRQESPLTSCAGTAKNGYLAARRAATSASATATASRPVATVARAAPVMMGAPTAYASKGRPRSRGPEMCPPAHDENWLSAAHYFPAPSPPHDVKNEHYS